MNDGMNRRDVIRGGAQLGIASAVFAGIPGAFAGAGEPPAGSEATLWPGFPRQNLTLVREVVGVAHSNEARVRELIKAHPALVNAWWDWGFGDWESPLGAASHVGQRGIALFLLEQGARIDIFAAAMLGMTDVVRAFVAAQPNIQRNLGPHGIPLLAHARAGGKHAAQTFAYLESLKDAGRGLAVTALSDERKRVYLGTYRCAKPQVSLTVRLNNNRQLVVDVQVGNEEVVRPNLYYAGNDEFFPPAGPSVRFSFQETEKQARTVVLRDHGLSITATRVS